MGWSAQGIWSETAWGQGTGATWSSTNLRGREPVHITIPLVREFGALKRKGVFEIVRRALLDSRTSECVHARRVEPAAFSAGNEANERTLGAVLVNP